MAAISQSLEQKLQQRLSPQQIQGIKLLELPTLQLEQRVKQEIEENPVLEEEEREPETDETQLTLEDYLRNEESAASYKLKVNNTSKDDDRRSPTLSQGMSLQDFLIEQLAYHDLDEREMTIARFIIGTLDDDGYLRRPVASITDDIAFTQGIEVSEQEVERIVGVIQMLDPAGIGARNLGECLIIQLRALREQTPAVKLAIAILSDHYDAFLKKHYERMMRRLGVTEEEFRAALEEIMHLNPKPTNGYADESSAASPNIIPDFLLDYNNGNFDLQLASRSVPDLKINSSYLRMAERAMNTSEQSEADKEALQFIKQKIESAKWFISALKQRQETLMKTMRAILHFQHDFFVEGDEAKLRPMILKDIADATGFDISTISRVVNSKYIQTHFGVFLLKYFFSEGLLTESGEEVSTREIKRILAEAIEHEDKRDPLTDEALMDTLTAKGYKIARRTVAKYREMLGIPASRLRKEL
ncbi:RNA polymerase factor sigma-54 [uncultured Rikenella sp.]|uniref:RNA polymerase factor sigma-54 n=1 Tax=uncultured Rikenella sp. TaxID=368003 RepID=UPI0026155188|nr:RNA polymerase factor sigma-54 [uncultured Rikenella sp.]